MNLNAANALQILEELLDTFLLLVSDQPSRLPTIVADVGFKP